MSNYKTFVSKMCPINRGTLTTLKCFIGTVAFGGRGAGLIVDNSHFQFIKFCGQGLVNTSEATHAKKH